MKEETTFSSLGEINIDGVKYLHQSYPKFDYLTDISNNEVKIHLKFTKNKEQRKQALTPFLK